MKRDLDLVRKILLELEAHEHGYPPEGFTIDGYTGEQIGYHVYLMGQAELLNVANTAHMGSTSPTAIPVSVTWDGHEFLEASRSPTVWQEAKKRMASAGVSVGLSTLLLLLRDIARAKLGL